jgi:hypothetical protein
MSAQMHHHFTLLESDGSGGFWLNLASSSRSTFQYTLETLRASVHSGARAWYLQVRAWWNADEAHLLRLCQVLLGFDAANAAADADDDPADTFQLRTQNQQGERPPAAVAQAFERLDLACSAVVWPVSAARTGWAGVLHPCAGSHHRAVVQTNTGTHLPSAEPRSTRGVGPHSDANTPGLACCRGVDGHQVLQAAWSASPCHHQGGVKSDSSVDRPGDGE